MDYHGRIMNISGGPDGPILGCSPSYSRGHRDARHMAAVIALEAQAEIKRLRRALEDVDRYVMPPGAKAVVKAALNT